MKHSNCNHCGKEVLNEEKYSFVFQGKTVELNPIFKNIKYCNECNQKTISKIIETQGILFNPFLKIKRERIKVDWKKYFNSVLCRNVLRNSTEGAWNTYHDLTDLLKAVGIVSREIRGNYSFENDNYHFRDFGGASLYFISRQDALEYLIFMGTESPTKEPVETEIYRISSKVTIPDILKYYQKIK
jgi:hypothetical protein